ncbi:MAG TPA: ferrous iron transporter B, partial [Holophaga sp.]|nr:ferrous iron transporter B [Holophaga sp.]
MFTVALAGNPNSGKTTIFNGLTGSRHHVGNWAGVTVERRSGFLELEGDTFEIVDLPGTYSLSAQSEDERIASRFLAGGEPSLIINVLDASNLEHNLYLTTQLLELGCPILFALNMMDDAERQGVSLDVKALERLLGGPVVPTVGNREEGLEDLKQTLLKVAQGEDPRIRKVRVNYGVDIEKELARLAEEIQRDEKLAAEVPPRWLALQLIERSPDADARIQESHARAAIGRQTKASLEFLESHLGADGGTLLAEQRYGFANGLVSEILARKRSEQKSLTEKLDTVLTHRWLGIPVFIAILIAMYSITFLVGRYPQAWIGAGFTWLQQEAGAMLPQGELTSLLVDGIIPGVGAVVVFVPVIMLLMGCIAFLEDTG